VCVSAVGLLGLGASESWAVKADGTTKTTCTLKYYPDGTSYWCMRVDPLEVQSFQLTVQFDPTFAQPDPSYGLNFGTNAVLSKETFNAMQTTVGGPLLINLAKVGAGALTLAGVQTYSGLLVTAGTVNLNSPLSGATIHESNGTLNINANTGNLTINSFGGTLNLNGSVTNSLINHSGGVLNLHANAVNSIINADATAYFDASQTLAELNIGDSAIVTLLQAPGPSPLPDFDGDLAASGLAADSFEAVPEPETIALLGAGIVGLLRSRRRPSS